MRFTKKSDIELWLLSKKIRNYRIEKDLIVHVDESVDLHSERLTRLPVQFGRVEGFFDICYNSLTSLEGVPYHVGGNFNATANRLNNLQYFPRTIFGNVSLNANLLRNLSGAENSHVRGDFIIHRNYDLANFTGAPKIIEHKLKIDIDFRDIIESWPGIVRGGVQFQDETPSYAGSGTITGEEFAILQDKFKIEQGFQKITEGDNKTKTTFKL